MRRMLACVVTALSLLAPTLGAQERPPSTDAAAGARVSLWFISRIVRGWIALNDGRPMYGYNALSGDPPPR